VETARGLSSQAALDALAVAAQAVGTLDRVRIVQMLVLVASTPERRAGPARRVDTDSRYGLASAARTSARCRPSTASNSPVESVSMCRASASSASEPDSGPPITSATKTVPVMASTISNACGAGRSRSSRGNASARASARVPSPCDSSSAA
jgi:hypothetical protein